MEKIEIVNGDPVTGKLQENVNKFLAEHDGNIIAVYPIDFNDVLIHYKE